MNKQQKYLFANWKMHKNVQEAVNYGQVIKNHIGEVADHVNLAIAASYTHLLILQQQMQDLPVKIIAQDGHAKLHGAYTSAVSLKQLADDGIQLALVGHSERRKVFGDTNQIVREKIHTALSLNMHVILCVGESLSEFNGDKTHEVLANQLNRALDGFPTEHLGQLTIAYEPVWAIGTGMNATPELAQKTIAYIRNYLANLFGQEWAQKIVILYGGSVNEKNVGELVSQPDINGVLVGGASLDPHTFISMAKIIGKL